MLTKAFSLHGLAREDFAPPNGQHLLVTGASGMLGRELALHLLRQGYHLTLMQRSDSGISQLLPQSLGSRVRQVQASITDRQAVAEAVQGVNGLIHLAAKVSMTGHWQDFFAVNVTGTQLLVQAAVEQDGLKDFLFISSPSVAHFGSAFMGQPALPAQPELARGNYARSKAMAEQLVLAADGQSLRVGVLRPHIVWGPGDTQLVERILARASQGRLPLLNEGNALIDTTYIDNAVAAIFAGYTRLDKIHGQPLVVSNGQPRPVAEIIAGMCEAVGIQAPRRSIPAAAATLAGSVIEKVWQFGFSQDEPPMTHFLAEQLSTSHWFDQRLTRELLDWTPDISLEQGYQKLAEFYGSNTWQRGQR
ncbi:MAG: SDR family NAD(P)-dependent oxidoreductase [Rothia sp. (in: high G+C Gram-positive bacteria)]|nr:SDR family NAD(P)-dependent oxidoreductase [Rothia sp. (in: high G+C Gram-positive bacteria)]